MSELPNQILIVSGIAVERLDTSMELPSRARAQAIVVLLFLCCTSAAGGTVLILKKKGTSKEPCGMLYQGLKVLVGVHGDEHERFYAFNAP